MLANQTHTLQERLLRVFLIFSPFVSWLAISSWLRLPVVLILLLFFFSIPFLLMQILKKPLHVVLFQEDFLMLLLLVFVWISFFAGYGETRSFNHALSYSFAVFMYLIFFKLIYYRCRLSISHLTKCFFFSLLLCDSVVILEWYLLNSHHIEIRSLFLTGGDETSNMNFYIQKFFYSVAGVTEEPGHTAYFTNILLPFAIYYAKKQEKNTALFVILISHTLCLLFLASAAGWAFLALSFFFVNIKSTWKYMKRYSMYLVGSVFILLVLAYFLSDTFYANYLFEKISLSDSNASAYDRKLKIAAAVREWLNAPFFGQGPGYGVEKYESGYFSTLLTILSDTGIFSALLFLCFFGLICFRLLKSKSEVSHYIGFSLVYLVLHSSICVLYYHFPFWIPILLVQLDSWENKQLADDIKS